MLSCYFPSPRLCFWALSLLPILSLSLLAVASVSCSFRLRPHTFSIRIILPKNSKSTSSIFRPHFVCVLVLRSFFASAFHTRRHLIASFQDILPTCLSIASSLRVDGIVISLAESVCVCVHARLVNVNITFRIICLMCLFLPHYFCSPHNCSALPSQRCIVMMIEMLQMRRAEHL